MISDHQLNASWITIINPLVNAPKDTLDETVKAVLQDIKAILVHQVGLNFSIFCEYGALNTSYFSFLLRVVELLCH